MNSKEQKIIIAVVAILIVIMFIISVAKKAVVPEEELTEEQKIELIKQEQKQETIDKLVNMTERDRIEYYCSEFIRNIDNGNYKSAYAVLNSKFKENYFKTEEEFISYVQTHFPKEIAIEYNNIERNGNTYVLWLNVSNALAVDSSKYDEMNVVIRENAVHDFELSFSVENN